MNRRALHVVALTSIWSLALAMPAIWDDFKAYYKPSPGSPIAKAECLTCHIRKGQRPHNEYGKDVFAALEKSRGQATIYASLVAIELHDSDGDGWTNGEEIRAGFLPGDPTSAPPGEPSIEPILEEPTQAPRAGQRAPGQLIPNHSFHPQIVHFPVGLFIFGALLEIVGIRRSHPGLRKAAFWNLAGATAFSALAVPTGLIASFREGYALTPWTPVFIHLVLAVASVLAMATMTFWRLRREPNGVLYLVLLIASAALVAVASHFGGELVYGADA